MKKADLNKTKGCLLGVAIGDALGFPVEFLSLSSIKRKYGEKGITEHVIRNGVAMVSDDTQMTLYTATGLLTANTALLFKGSLFSKIPVKEKLNTTVVYCYRNYIDWVNTQQESKAKNEKNFSWLVNVPEIDCRRGPGSACLSALSCGKMGGLKEERLSINDSKGCGGLMRIAPVGLYLPRLYGDEAVMFSAAKIAAITHGHTLGYVTAAMLARIISELCFNNTPLLDAVNIALSATLRFFRSESNAEYLEELQRIVNLAISLSSSEISDETAISLIGEGFIAEETLAIAIYCALKHPYEFEKAIIAAVNHGGDSDSTGAVCGSILGAHLGAEAIPQKFLNVELKNVICEISEDLCRNIDEKTLQDKTWVSKYLNTTYPNY